MLRKSNKGSRVSLRRRIHASFALLSFLFVINGIITVVILNRNKKERNHISAVTDPTIESLHNLRKLVRESMMFTTNWVFIRSDGEDKKSLKEIHNSTYPALKKTLAALSAKWYQQEKVNNLNIVFTSFETMIRDEEYIMNLLQDFEDYNDPIKRFAAEDQLESIVIPKIAGISKSLNQMIDGALLLKRNEEAKLDADAMFLRNLIIVLVTIMVCLGILFSVYMARKIIRPIRQIHELVNDL